MHSDNRTTKHQDQTANTAATSDAGTDAGPVNVGGMKSPEATLLNQIVSTSLGPLSRLGETLNLTLDQVSEWIAKPENRRQVFNLLGLLDAQTQLLIAQQRVMAAVQLAEIIRDERAAPETVRRACKDLLSMRLIERAHVRGTRGGDDLEPLPLPKPLNLPEHILRTFREIGA